MAERVGQQVDEDLFQAVVVGPDDRQAGIALHLHHRRTRQRQAGDGRVEHERDVTPVALQAEDP